MFLTDGNVRLKLERLIFIFGQIYDKNVGTRIETILHIVLQFQVDRACSSEEKRQKFGEKKEKEEKRTEQNICSNNCLSASTTWTQQASCQSSKKTIRHVFTLIFPCSIPPYWLGVRSLLSKMHLKRSLLAARHSMSEGLQLLLLKFFLTSNCFRI